MIRVAKTEGGLVRGQAAGDTYVSVFKGIPFAAPPVGKNRWRISPARGALGGGEGLL